MASYNFGKEVIVSWLKRDFEKGSTALDVGACDGKWGKLLSDHFVLDAVEAFAPNAASLPALYRRVFVNDIADMEYGQYDLIIFGDVIEHMSVEKAQKVINYAWPRCKDMIVAVPYLYKQDAIYGNPWEVHIQDDLTPENFKERYPGLSLVWGNSEYGYYRKSKQ